MTKDLVLQQLANAGIRMESDFAVPVNGSKVPLPYLVTRTKETVTGSDNGKVRILKIEWLVALFSRNRDFALEKKLLESLYGFERLEIIPFPDGAPYQTTFKFTTYQIMK